MALFPLLFTSAHTCYRKIRRCGPDGCTGSHFKQHARLFNLAQFSLLGAVVTGVIKLTLVAALIPAADRLAAQGLVFDRDGYKVKPGDTLTYQVRMKNTGASAATNIAVLDMLPSGVEFRSLTINGSSSSATPLANGTLTFSFATLAPEATHTIEIVARVQNNAPSLLQNQAQATSSEITKAVVSNTVTNPVVVAVVVPLVEPVVEVIAEPEPPPPPPPQKTTVQQTVKVVAEPLTLSAEPITPTVSQEPTPVPAPIATTTIIPEPSIEPLPVAVVVERKPVLEQAVEQIADVVITKLEEVAPAVISKPIRVINTVVLENPVFEKVSTDIVIPTVVATAVATSAVAASVPSFLTYLHYLATQPLLLFVRRKRRSWGTIYNAITKLPVDLALVRLYDAQNNRLVQTRVTDRYGRFAFLPPPGTYRIAVTKDAFQFPSDILKDKTADVQFTALYHGEPLVVEKAGILLAPNIPLDPAVPSEPSKAILRRARLYYVNLTMGAFSIGISAVAFIITPRPAAFIPLVVHVIGYIWFRRLAAGKKPKILKQVLDRDSKVPLPYTIARIFDTQYNKLLETQVTDHSGRYGFLAGQNRYYVTFEKGGYGKVKTAEINLQSRPAPEVISLEVKMSKDTYG